jgi:hypothetical protein
MAGAAQHNGASLALRHAGEADHAVLANHNLLDELARAERDELGMIERGGDLRAGDQRLQVQGPSAPTR